MAAFANLPRPLPNFEEGQFTLNGLQWLGFDLDHTLARYKLKPAGELIFNSLVKFLVRHKAFPASVADFVHDPNFITKGVVCDIETGSFITVDADKRVSGRRLFHGTREQVFSVEAADDVHPAVLTPHIYPGPISEFDPLATDSPGQSERYFSFSTYFDISAGHLYALLVDLRDRLAALPADSPELEAHAPLHASEIDAQERAEADINPHWYHHEQLDNRALLPVGAPVPAPLTPEQKRAAAHTWAQKSYKELWKDMIQGFRHNFGECNRGYYFPEFFRRPSKFLYKRPDLKDWLWRMRHLYGKKIWLLTNSRHQYAHALLQYMFDTPDWAHWFDLSVVWGRKPNFWSGSHPFIGVTAWKDLSPEQIQSTQAECRELLGDPDAECFYYPQMVCHLDQKVEDIVLPQLELAEVADPGRLGPAGPVVGIGNYSTLQRLLFPNCPAVRAKPEDLCDDIFEEKKLQSPVEDISAGLIQLKEDQGDEEEDEAKEDRPGMDVGVDYLREPHRCAAIYFGDNLRTDVMAVKLYTTWLAGAILEEAEEHWPEGLEQKLRERLEAAGGEEQQLVAAAPRELPHLDHGVHFPAGAQAASCCDGSGAPSHHVRLVEGAAEAQHPQQKYHRIAVNPNWGSFFLAGSSNHRDSYWHDFVMRHANVTVADVTDFVDVRPLTQPELGRNSDNMDEPLKYRQPFPDCYWPEGVLVHEEQQQKQEAPPRVRRPSLVELAELNRQLRSTVHVWQPPMPQQE